MIKVLISGLSLGKDVGGVCNVCGVDHEWLLRFPSAILWVDKILLTPSTWDDIHVVPDKESAFQKSTALVFNLLRDAGLVEIVDPSGVLGF